MPSANFNHLQISDNDDEDVDRLRTFSASKGGEYIFHHHCCCYCCCSIMIICLDKSGRMLHSSSIHTDEQQCVESNGIGIGGSSTHFYIVSLSLSVPHILKSQSHTVFCSLTHIVAAALFLLRAHVHWIRSEKSFRCRTHRAKISKLSIPSLWLIRTLKCDAKAPMSKAESSLFTRIYICVIWKAKHAFNWI